MKFVGNGERIDEKMFGMKFGCMLLALTRCTFFVVKLTTSGSAFMLLLEKLRIFSGKKKMLSENINIIILKACVFAFRQLKNEPNF